VPHERVKDDFAGARRRGLFSVFDTINLRTESERRRGRTGRLRGGGRVIQSFDRLYDALLPVGAPRVGRPVSTQQELANGALAHLIELTDREKKIQTKAEVIDTGEDEWCLAKAAQLLAQRSVIERALGGGNELSLAPYLDAFADAAE